MCYPLQHRGVNNPGCEIVNIVGTELEKINKVSKSHSYVDDDGMRTITQHVHKSTVNQTELYLMGICHLDIPFKIPKFKQEVTNL